MLNKLLSRSVSVCDIDRGFSTVDPVTTLRLCRSTHFKNCLNDL